MSDEVNQSNTGQGDDNATQPNAEQGNASENGASQGSSIQGDASTQGDQGKDRPKLEQTDPKAEGRKVGIERRAEKRRKRAEVK